MKAAGAGVFPGTLAIMKSVVPLKTIPVGDELPFAPGAFGTTTGEGGETTLPAPVYSAEVPVPALLIHHGLEALRANPQEFLKVGSWTATGCPLKLLRSETRLVCV